MKRVIDGKTYSTETATEVAHWTNGAFLTDFVYFEETLYRTKRGKFFLHGQGHCKSKYAEHVAGITTWGDALKPISDRCARKWLEKRGETNAISIFFGM